jgi:hypothetical protein
MKKSFERVGKVVAVGLAAGIGVTACSEAKPTATTSAEVRMQSQIDNIRSDNTSFVGSNAVNNAGIEKTWVSVLPNGTQVDLQVTYPADVNKKNIPTGNYSASAVEGIDVTFYQPGVNFKNTKPEAGYDIGKEVDGRWDATYYQYLSSTSPFSIGEENQSQVETQEYPGSIPPKTTADTAEAHSIYNQVVNQVEVVINDIGRNGDVHISPTEVKA